MTESEEITRLRFALSEAEEWTATWIECYRVAANAKVAAEARSSVLEKALLEARQMGSGMHFAADTQRLQAIIDAALAPQTPEGKGEGR